LPAYGSFLFFLSTYFLENSDMMAIIRVALDVPLPRLFDYLSEDANVRDIGARVIVSFGRRRLTGIVVEIGGSSSMPTEKLKACEKILRDIPPLPGDLIYLGRFCSDYYQVPIGEALLSMLPPRLRRDTPLTIPSGTSHYSITELGRLSLESLPARQKNRRQLLGALAAGDLSAQDFSHLCKGSGAYLRELIDNKWIEERHPTSDSCEFIATHSLNNEQFSACNQVAKELNTYACFLLLGITGSGKTEVYLNLISRAISDGRQALVLVPEIALTPSLEALFRERFRNAILCIQHSNMGQTERARTWLLASRGEAQIVLGTRLAVFVPMPNLGLIVVDEEQDSSYKQQEGLRYSARDLAIVRARKVNVPVLLCSATPSLETLHHAQSGRYRLLKLSQRAHQLARLPTIRLVDTRQVPMHEGLSEPLIHALAKRLERGEQSVLFLNRRGYAPVLACAHCGWIGGCPRCSVNLVIHLSKRLLRCHHCGYQTPIPRTCAQCGNLDIAPFGRGTQRLESEVGERFPQARVLRIDSDSAGGGLKSLIETAQSGGADILIGTQILAKGHHFEKVTLVGVLNADAGLFAADYRSPERLFAQLQQVSGRAGRAELPGEVLIQTRYPTHPLYLALQNHDYEGYANELLQQRRDAGFPPFMHEAALRAQAPRMQDALSFLTTAVSLAPEAVDPLTIYDPSPATLSKLAGLERAQVVIQSRSRPILQEFLRTWNASLHKHPSRIRWHFDVDPIEF
jgi:primosomal protein N' (replication factor Y) (superfamily II helicase)